MGAGQGKKADKAHNDNNDDNDETIAAEPKRRRVSTRSSVAAAAAPADVAAAETTPKRKRPAVSAAVSAASPVVWVAPVVEAAVATPVCVVTACDGVPQTLLDQLVPLGLKFTADPALEPTTHLVTELGLKRRTAKALLAFAAGQLRHVVTPAFLKAVKAAGKLVPEADFALASERRLGSLADALARMAVLRLRGVRVFEKIHFWISPRLAASVPIAESVIRCAHGVFHAGVPTSKTSGRVEIVVIDADEPAANWSALAAERFAIHKWDFVCDSVLSCKVDWEREFVGGLKVQPSFNADFQQHWIEE